jgi:hypothetical protein
MSVSQNIAERLITHAKGVAVDLLFPHVQHVDRAPETAPSGDLLVERWSSLPASTAIAFAKSVNDTDILDRIAAKEKRKTVRVELASNPNLHPVTRLFYLQEAGRTSDHDLVRASLSGMSPAEMLGYLVAKDPVTRYIRLDNVARCIVENDDVATLQAYAAALEPREFDSLCESVLHANPVAALAIFEKSGVRPGRLELSRYLHLGTENIDAWRYLYKVDPENVGTQVLRAFSDLPDQLAEIDPGLVRNLLEHRRYELPQVRTLVKHGLLRELLAENPRLSSEAADWLIAHIDDDSTRSQVILLHPEPTLTVEHVSDHKRLAITGIARGDARSVLNWLVPASSALGVQRTVEVLKILIESDSTQSQGLRADLLSNLSQRCDVQADVLIAALDDELFSRVVSLPVVNDPGTVLERAERLGGNVETAVAESVLQQKASGPEVQLRSAEILLSANRQDAILSWLANSPVEIIRPILERHRNRIAAMLADSRELQRSSWAPEMIDLVLPTGGWGSVRSDILLSAAMDYLHRQIGTDRKVWEAALVLFEGWTGSLDDLTQTASRI